MKKYLPLILRLIVATILIQTLRFKFTAHPDSVYIFTKIGMEPYGRITVGVIELAAGILLLIPKTIWLGALVSIGVIGGAILMHLFILGVEINGDNGLLFLTALLVFGISWYLLLQYRRDIPFTSK